MNLGVCYYPEHWDEARWAVDAKLLRAAGLTVVRMAEFAWSKLEPRGGEFELDWLERAVEIFATENFRLVLGTPTGAPPVWLSRAHPETLPVDAQGNVKNVGARRHYCPTSPIYREYCRRIVFTLAARFGQDKRVIGWQIDNEFGEGNTARCYCPRCAAAFRVWLEKKYSTIENLNTAWGNAFWSQEYNEWGQVQPPNLLGSHDGNPSQVLDYDRFASDMFATFQQVQLDVIRRATGAIAGGEGEGKARQFITHNFMGLFADLDYHKLAAPLDFVTWDSYPTGHGERGQALREGADDGLYAYDVGDPYLTGLAHAVMYGLKRAPFWIMEQQAGNVNWGLYNPAPRPNVLHLWLWHNFAAGVETTVFFRERATWFAQEQYHSGLLKHDGTPAQGYADLLTFGAQHAVMTALQDTCVENDAALLISYEDLWAVARQPHRSGFLYWNVVLTWYAALLRAGVPCDVISKDADISKYKLVIAPCLHLADETLAEKLKAYAASGGLLVLGIRSGFKTPTNLVTEEPLPGVLRGLVGATVTSWASLPPQVTQTVALIWRGWMKVEATRWVETLETEGAGTIASYVGGPLDGQTAMTAHLVGNGRVMYCGWLPNQSQADALVGMLLPEAGIEPIGMLPQGVMVGKRMRDGETFWVLMNFTDEPKRVWMNGLGWKDAMGGAEVTGEVTVEGRGVRVVGRREGMQANSTRHRDKPGGSGLGRE